MTDTLDSKSDISSAEALQTALAGKNKDEALAFVIEADVHGNTNMLKIIRERNPALIPVVLRSMTPEGGVQALTQPNKYQMGALALVPSRMTMMAIAESFLFDENGAASPEGEKAFRGMLSNVQKADWILYERIAGWIGVPATPEEQIEAGIGKIKRGHAGAPAPVG